MPSLPPPSRGARPELALLVRQVRAIDAWRAARRAEEQAEQAERARAPLSRERNLDLARRADVVRRQDAAVVERAEQHLRASGQLLRACVGLRAVVAHRDPWFADRVCRALEREQVRVVCWLDNGADALGAVVVEQPDLLLVEDRLPMTRGADLLREALPLSSGTVGVGQAESPSSAAELERAGAREVHLRRVPPDEVATAAVRLLH